MSNNGEVEVLWRPPHGGSTPMDKYRRHVNTKFTLGLQDSHKLQEWSVSSPHEFWIDLYDYVGIIPPLPRGTTRAFDDTLPISSIPPFFENVRLNYTENVLSGRDPDAVALIGLREGEPLTDAEQLTWRELTERVRLTRSALLRNGIKKGDRVAALVSNSSWIIVLFLASAAIGAVFTSISPDMGAEGSLSRLQQVTPAVLFADSHVTYKGRRQSAISKLTAIVKALSFSPKVFVLPLVGRESFSYPVLIDFLSAASAEDKLEYLHVPFSHPLYILYSSGTSGSPKCIVHQHGVIIQLKKIAFLHNSLNSDSVVFQYSSTSWVLWNVMNGHLSAGATIICYDGSPLWPDPSTMLKIVEKFRVTYWGTSPRYLLELEISKIIPRDAFDLSALRMVTTTGATLTADQYRWFYGNFPPLHLSSVAGGTDIVTSWLASDPAGPVYAGEIQMDALGMAVDIADSETGESIKHTGQAGELVCPLPFPSMPVYFWGDTDNTIYLSSYFERFPNRSVWAQHDWMSTNLVTKGSYLLGRSDGVLNPSGIRFGSAEIYSVVEGPLFNSVIAETLCVGRRRAHDKDEAVFLFVRMRPEHNFTPDLVSRIKVAIREALSPRHVPKFVLEVPEIPTTINGKKVEIAVKQIISGNPPKKISETVVNRHCLMDYARFADLEVAREAKL